MTPEQFTRLRAVYWVLAYRNEKAWPFDWLVSRTQSRPVPNPTMVWRRPTYEEMVDRQQAFEADPARFEERASGRDLRKYDTA